MEFETLVNASKDLLAQMNTERNRIAPDSIFQVFHTLEKGRKYHRIVSDTMNTETGKAFDQRSCAGFIDNEGNVYKSAGWAKPAKTARGNIFQNAKTDGSGFIRSLR
ncbi:hypothetical protein POP12_177 [Pectobacterium phage POP12]|nr:hypothetical protein POP12_177 [Pectobacterium phage POP12]